MSHSTEAGHDGPLGSAQNGAAAFAEAGVNAERLDTAGRFGSWQLSLRSLFIGTSVVAVLLAAFQFPPLAVLLIVLIELFAFAAALVCAIYGRGWIRPFAILASLAMFLGYFLMASTNLQSPAVAAFFMMVHLVASAVVGLLGAVLHGYLLRHSGFVPVPNLPVLKDYLVNDVQETSKSNTNDSNTE